MAALVPVSGNIQNISPVGSDCCSQMVTLRIGMNVTAFYDASLPVPLIFPPQYQAVIIGRKSPNETIYAGFFNNNLVSEDNSLKLNLSRSTEVLTSNGQRFNCNPGGQLLIVYYTTTTRSIPPQTTPRRIIVMC